MNSRRIVRWGVLALAAMWLGSWGVARLILPEPNPSGRYAGTILNESVDAVLRRACFDCHSHETRWPWYAYAPIADAVLAQDVNHGRGHLNFSRWDELSPQKRAEGLQDALDQIRKEEMPLAQYLWLHPDAHFSPEEFAALREAIAAVYGAQYTEPKPDKEHDHDDGPDDDHDAGHD